MWCAAKCGVHVSVLGGRSRGRSGVARCRGLLRGKGAQCATPIVVQPTHRSHVLDAGARHGCSRQIDRRVGIWAMRMRHRSLLALTHPVSPTCDKPLQPSRAGMRWVYVRAAQVLPTSLLRRAMRSANPHPPHPHSIHVGARRGLAWRPLLVACNRWSNVWTLYMGVVSCPQVPASLCIIMLLINMHMRAPPV